jgi:anti-sigma factor RsiW
MDRHRHYDELLGPYVLGALDPAEERQMKRHLGGCPGYRKEAEALLGVHRILRSIQGEVMIAVPPPGLKARVLEGFSRRSHRNP